MAFDLKSIGKTITRVPRVSLRGDDESAELEPPPELKDTDSRLQLQGEIARGGMGAILKGRDADLGRDLAVKVLLDSHKDNPDVVARFVEEALIGGQLQHPGIVPVHELGQFADQLFARASCHRARRAVGEQRRRGSAGKRGELKPRSQSAIRWSREDWGEPTRGPSW